MNKKPYFRIGNQSAFSASSITQPFEYAVESGFDAFEWFPDKKGPDVGWDEGDLDIEARRRIRDTALLHDISMSVHAPWQVNLLGPDAWDLLTVNLQFAQDIGASLVNIHLYANEGIDAFVEAILPLLSPMADLDIRLSIENTPLTSPNDFNLLFARFEEIEPDSRGKVGMCLDIGHANLCERTRNDYIRFIDELDSRVPIIHVHLHENYGDSDSHLVIFTGPAGRDASGVLGVLERLKSREFSGSIILEQWPQPPGMLNDARDRLRAMIHDLLNAGDKQGMKDDHNFVKLIAEADRRCQSWREKLGWINALLARDGPDLNTGNLVYLSIYLYFIGSGDVPCSENGGHYRPSHHARASGEIYDHLSKMTTPDNQFIVRKIYPWLPSSNGAFVRKEPLTRIRDIAHRNDIPKELKREIKHTLQNKLHRCAGPEDLATSSALLRKITAPEADYSQDFVEEFRLFHEELTEFFNARTLDDQLKVVIEKCTPQEVEAIHEFLEVKEKSPTLKRLISLFRLLTTLRVQFHKRLVDSKNNDAREFQLTDIRLEDFSFVILGQLINRFEGLEGGVHWSQSLECLSMGIENLGLSGLGAEECRAIGSELNLWRKDFEPQDREQLIRLKATVDRCGRLTEEYCKRILALFPEKAQALGNALGVDEYKIRIFSEADIRRHLVFQLSRLIGAFLKEIGRLGHLPPWDRIVPGKMSGYLMEIAHLGNLKISPDEPTVVVTERVEGDEYIPAGVVGVVVLHETPHLSHFAIRARQQGVAFGVCRDVDGYAQLKGLHGRQIALDMSGEDVTLQVLPGGVVGPENGVRKEGQKDISVPEVSLAAVSKLFPLHNVGLDTGGAKSIAARRLEELSYNDKAGFKTPPSLVVPFGVMEWALRADPPIQEEYYTLLGRLNEIPQEDFERVLGRLQGLLSRLGVPGEITSGVMEKFNAHDRLMVRSSANSEDLESLAGAGLYESIPNVSPSDTNDAVKKVWSSLWTRRAAINRREIGIPHDKVHMAVLIQQMLVPEFSFIMHTVNPISRNPDEIYMELAVGLGKSLASGGTPGSPYRMVFRKSTKEYQVLAFSSFSCALWPCPDGGLDRRTIDYSGVGLSVDKRLRRYLAVRLGAIGKFVEDKMGVPQNIEGLVIGDQIYLVQTRAQQGAG